MNILELTMQRVNTIEERARRNEMTALHVFQSMNSLINGLISEREQLMTQKPDLYIVYNGVCISGIYYDQESAQAYADQKQKEHSLSGSWASFHIKHLFSSPIPAQQSPRITEQDVQEVCELLNTVVDEDVFMRCESWYVRCRALLNKLNAKNGGE